MITNSLVINDPIHGVMEFMDSSALPIRAVVDHPFCQRMRYIKQLGMADLVFPGAAHTRFNHSLGTAYLANKILYQLDFPHKQKQAWQPLVTLAAFLHDIGHGPFSHAFEQLTIQAGLNPISHEDWTVCFLQEMTTAKNREILTCIEAMITKSGSLDHELQFVADIISSQLDADRLDYLLRDSYFCGVPYGKYDLNWLLHCMRVLPDKKGALHLGVSFKGIGAIEGFLMARRLMTQNVYYHPMIHLLQSLTMAFLGECCAAIQVHAMQTLCPLPLKIFLEGLALYRAEQISKAQFMQTYFSVYSTLSDHHIYQWIEIVALHGTALPKSVFQLGQKLYYRQLSKVVRIPLGKETRVQKSVTNLIQEREFKPWEINLHVKHHTTYNEALGKILVQDKEVLDITQVSFLVHALANQNESVNYLYIDKTLLCDAAVIDLTSSLEFV